jgi:ubiquinone/menaquinone biosynthesis C-methylase UbiE
MVLADYNDKNYDYTKYWQGRDYENDSEFMALERLLPRDYAEGKEVIDVGGGFGRLLPILKRRFGNIYIFDYSKKLLETAEENASKLDIKITTINGDVNEINSLVDTKYDCVTMIRVSHHLDDLEKVFIQIREILKDDGIFIVEIANKIHFKSFISNLIKGNFSYLNLDSVSVATKDVTFLNHHPKKVESILKDCGFTITDKLSVSNFRHQFFKKYIPSRILLFLEKMMQKIGANIYFGPSIFFKISKN